MNDFDRHERARWTARAGAYQRSFALLCAYPAELVLDVAGVRAGTAVLDVGTGPGTVAALAVTRGADWWSGPANGLSVLGEILESLSPAEVAKVRAAYDELSAAHLGAGGLLELPTAALLGSAVKPG